MEEYYECIVNKVTDGPHGPYAVATCKEVDWPITFSCEKSVWDEPHQPRPGEIVLLYDVHKTTGGWRAGEAKAKRPEKKIEDEKINVSDES